MTSELDPTDVDLKQTEPTLVAKAGAALQAIAGAFLALSGLQILGVRFVERALDALPYALMALGVVQLTLGALVYRARTWAALAGAAVSVVAAGAALFWLYYGFSAGLVSCIAFVTVPWTLLAAIFAFLAIGPVRRAHAARQRLADHGMSLGL